MQYLGGVEYVFPLHSAICDLAADGQTNFLFILVQISSINVAEANIYSYFGSLCSLTLRNLREQPKI